MAEREAAAALSTCFVYDCVVKRRRDTDRQRIESKYMYDWEQVEQLARSRYAEQTPCVYL